MERTIEAAFLLLLVVPLLRIAIEPGLRRRFHAFPPIQALLLTSLGAYVTGVIAVAMMAPTLLRIAAVTAVLVLAFLFWNGRASFGSARRLPPGSLSFFSTAPWRDPYYYKKAGELYGPVFKFRHMLEPAVGIVGLARVSDFIRRNDQDLLIPPAPFNTLIPGGFVRYMSGAEHKDTAGLLRSAFTQAVVESCEADFAAESRCMLDSIAASGEHGSDPRLVIDRMVLNETMLCFVGLRPGAELDRFAQLYDIGDYRQLARVGQKRAKAAILDVISEMRALAASSATGADSRRSFLGELVASHPEAIASDEAMGNFAYALHTGRLDVSGLLVWLLAVLGENPAWVAKLNEVLKENECDALKVGGLADRIVRETLRLRQSEFLLRRVRHPIEWEGFRIPSGWHVRFCIAESHRSRDTFDRPEEFDPDRFIQPPERTRYSPFGFAPHLCPGEHLTRAMGRHLAAEISRGYEISVRNEAPWEFSGFHWRPNSGMRVFLRPLS